MKTVNVEGLSIRLDVSNNFDRKEIQECLDILNLHLQRCHDVGAQIIGINDISDNQIVAEIDEDDDEQ